MSDEPKIITLLEDNGDFKGYPLTITKAVLDFESQQSLDTILSQLVDKQAIIVKDNALQYHLEVGGKQSGSTIHINNNWLESVSFDYHTKKFKFIFTTKQGKVTIYVHPDALVGQYFADEKTITLDKDTFKVMPNVFASANQGKLADSALQNIVGDSNTQYIVLSSSEKQGENGETCQTIHADVTFGSIEEDTEGLALMSDVKNYVNNSVSTINTNISSILNSLSYINTALSNINTYIENVRDSLIERINSESCSFVVVDSTEYPDITSYFNNG